ncbi:MAG: hypothetical protein CVV41_08570 [Candidatus Riflebacteria bacterium HGW-Riflebacteria-1]|nr:MAG: hypothetical protein CVV41_08570 [Candidatus Riflebacteria bacterium HGW-Riflebacteria-1]
MQPRKCLRRFWRKIRVACMYSNSPVSLSVVILTDLLRRTNTDKRIPQQIITSVIIHLIAEEVF